MIFIFTEKFFCILQKKQTFSFYIKRKNGYEIRSSLQMDRWKKKRN